MFLFTNIPPPLPPPTPGPRIIKDTPPQPPSKGYIAEDVSVVRIIKKIKNMWKNPYTPGEYSYFKTHVKTIIVGTIIFSILSLLGIVPYIIVWLDIILQSY